MVFCGKPSKACALCRTRRIKCDQKNPACTQCIRAGKECPGYRDQLNLLFRDENERTVRKAKSPKSISSAKQKTVHRAGKSPSTSPIEVLEKNNYYPSPVETSLTLHAHPKPLEDEGVKFFLTHYMTVAKHGIGQIDMKSKPLWPGLFMQHTMVEAISSVGLAGLSNVTKDPKYSVMARQKQADMMKVVIQDLGNKANADLDLLLKRVVMLIVFELINAAPGSSHPQSLGVHLDGAAGLLRTITKQKNQMNLPTTKMQLQFCFALHINYFQMERPPSPELADLSRHISQNPLSEDTTAQAAFVILIRFVDLHASVRRKELTDPGQIILELLLLDTECEEWDRALPPEWSFAIDDADEPSAIFFEGKYHSYSDSWYSRILNHYRWMRILLNEELLIHLAQLEHLTVSHLAQQRKSLAIINILATDICHCISSHFWRIKKASPGDTLSPQMSGVFLMIWPLSIAGAAIGVSEHMHHWCIERLDVISNQLGIQSAARMKDRTQKYRRKWIRAGILTAYSAHDINWELQMEPLD